jgi:ABC-type glycerol-3-phosphate transport system substrate-binding protein
MKRELIKYFMLCCIFTVTIFICGCGNGSSAVSSKKESGIKQEETIYVAQSLPLPEYTSFDGAYSDGGDLHYAAAKFNQDSQQYETAFYTLKQGAAEPEMRFGLGENQRVLKITMDGAGNSYFIGYEALDENQMKTGYMLYKLDSQGALQLSLDLNEYSRGQEQVVIQNLAVDEENHIILAASDQNIYVLNPNGQLLFETRADGAVYEICASGGKVFILHGGIDGAEVRQIDVSGKKLSSKLEHNIPGVQFYMAADGKDNLLIATEESVYQYNIEKGETRKKFDWKTYDLLGMTAGILLPYGENGVLAISRDYTANPMGTEATVFREAAEGEAVISDKTILTLGTVYSLSSAANREIAAFNKANQDVKIEVKNYYDVTNGENYDRLYTELIAGNGPDLLMLPSNRVDQLAERGILEDLNPYFTEDENLNRSDFLENILNAFETEGHLYGMPVSFRIATIVGKTSIVGEESGWNLEELITFSEGFPEETDIFNEASKSGVLSLLKFGLTDQLVNMDNTDNPLNRELLIKILEFANQYKSDDQYTYNINLPERVMEKQLILFDSSVYSGSVYRLFSNSVFEEPVTFIGYPTEGRNGNLIYSDDTFAINSRCEHKDIAWAFICGLLSEETQIMIGKGGFPIRKAALEEHFEVVKTYHDDDVLWTPGGIFRRESNRELTEEEIAPVRDLIQNVDTAWHELPYVDQIIEEEADFYFSGTKPVEEVVDVIENRVRTYVNENK